MPPILPINLSKLLDFIFVCLLFNRLRMGHLVLQFCPMKERMLCLYLVLLSSKVKRLIFIFFFSSFNCAILMIS